MTAFGFMALLQATEARLVAGLHLLPLPVPSVFAEREGTWKGAPVTLAARAYRSSTFTYARFVTVTGTHLEIANALCLSAPIFPLPIFGADLVGFAADRGVAVADLSPVVPDGPLREEQRATLAAARRGTPELPSAGDLPAWCRPWFSPETLFARPSPGQAGEIARAFDAFPAALIALAQSTGPEESAAGAVLAAQRGYCVAHRDEDKGLGMLAKLFDAEFARRFIGEFLFPERVPTW